MRGRSWFLTSVRCLLAASAAILTLHKSAILYTRNKTFSVYPQISDSDFALERVDAFDLVLVLDFD